MAVGFKLVYRIVSHYGVDLIADNRLFLCQALASLVCGVSIALCIQRQSHGEDCIMVFLIALDRLQRNREIICNIIYFNIRNRNLCEILVLPAFQFQINSRAHLVDERV